MLKEVESKHNNYKDEILVLKAPRSKGLVVGVVCDNIELLLDNVEQIVCKSKVNLFSDPKVVVFDLVNSHQFAKKYIGKSNLTYTDLINYRTDPELIYEGLSQYQNCKIIFQNPLSASLFDAKYFADELERLKTVFDIVILLMSYDLCYISFIDKLVSQYIFLERQNLFNSLIFEKLQSLLHLNFQAKQLSNVTNYYGLKKFQSYNNYKSVEFVKVYYQKSKIDFTNLFNRFWK